MTLQSLLNTTVNVTTFTEQQVNGARKKVFAGTPAYTGLPARIRPLSSQEIVRYRRDGLEVTHTVYVGSPNAGSVSSITIRQGDRIDFGTRNFEVRGKKDVDEVGRYYIVTAAELSP